MKEIKLPYNRIDGKTYSLFDHFDTTENYYETVKSIVSDILYDEPDISLCIRKIRKYSKLSAAKKLLSKDYYFLPFNYKINDRIIRELSRFTIKTRSHIQTLALNKYFDNTLSTFEFQYHLYMLEIELNNTVNKKNFISSEIKIALLPHCLRESIQECKAKPDKFDDRCSFCRNTCYINAISRLLLKHKIMPYIWMKANLEKLGTLGDKKPGIIGIACLPELVQGLRRCDKLNISAVGIPLNSNRCIRWMDDFYPNSVDLQRLDMLLTKN